jgi:hypothetical protein
MAIKIEIDNEHVSVDNTTEEGITSLKKFRGGVLDSLVNIEELEADDPEKAKMLLKELADVRRLSNENCNNGTCCPTGAV